MNGDITKYEQIFLSYAKKFCQAEHEQKSILKLKIIHSKAVLNFMRSLISEEELKPYARACLLAALFHDIARFEQFSRWRTFKDSLSCNHGILGVKILKKQGWLQAESKYVQSLVLAAISMHNRFKVPPGLAHDIRLVTLALRDADKLDILRIMSEHFMAKSGRDAAVVLHAKDEPKAYSKNIITAVYSGHLASYNDIVYVNDFKLLLGTWLHEMYFGQTQTMLKKAGYLELILQNLPEAEPVQRAKHYLLNLLNQYPNEV